MSDLAELMGLNRNALIQQWQKTFGGPAPGWIQENLLREAIGWQMQAAKSGGLTAAERRQLRSGIPSCSSQVYPGSRLIRVWQGETHQVMVLEDGYLYADKRWRSLSAIAKAITGTRWSGPVFFGVKK
jgi:Protein of unknown function (DUF2924)